MTDTVEEKALAILRERRLQIDRVDTHGGVVVASCKGRTGDYMLGYDMLKKEWRCTCASVGNCSHLEALRMVVRR